jgi:phage shock protein A
MGVLERIENIVKANLNDMLDKAGDPEKVLKQAISEMESELANARDQVAAAIREGKRLRMLRIENEKQARSWQDKATLAVQHGRDDLAREAIIRKRSALTVAEEYRKECDLHDQIIESLKSALKALEEKINEARYKKEGIIKRKRQASINSIIGRDVIAKQKATFSRMEDRIISFNAEVEALSDSSTDDLTVKQREEELDAELAKLKEKMRGEDS